MKYLLCFSLVSACLLARGKAYISPYDINYVFYSREQFAGLRFNLKSDPTLKHVCRVFNSAKPTVILIHGWRDNYGADSNTFVREAILSKTNANIIKVDWDTYAQQSYLTSKDAVPIIGKYAGQLLRILSDKFRYSLEKVTLVGFSLGAHIAGNVGKELKGQVGLIVALDPAGPFISSQDLDYSVGPADAKYVQSIHTNAGTLGMRDAVGHADFYPNGGSRQPGCGADITGGCAHNRAWEYYAESITNNGFVAKRCASWDDYRRDRCETDVDVRLMGGLSKLDKKAKGVYYLATENESPYSQG